MGYSVKQSQTSRPLAFKMRQASDHIAALTGATPIVVLSKNGGAFAPPSGIVSEIGNGWYKVAANATDTNTLGPLALYATAAGADACDELYEVVAYDPDVSIPTASDFANIDVGNVTKKVLGGGSGTITGTGVRADNRDGDAIPTAAQNAAAIDTATLATDIAAELQGAGVTYTVVSPVTSSSTLDVVQGMDYYTADGRDIEFTFVRDYVPTSCKLTLASGATVTVTSTDITESSGSGSGRFSVRFQLPRADGDDLDAGTGTFEVYSVVGTRQVPEIAEGVLTVRRRLSA